jgi:hypothetical protein
MFALVLDLSDMLLFILVKDEYCHVTNNFLNSSIDNLPIATRSEILKRLLPCLFGLVVVMKSYLDCTLQSHFPVIKLLYCSACLQMILHMVPQRL